MRHSAKRWRWVLTLVLVLGGRAWAAAAESAGLGDRFMSRGRRLTFEGRRAGEGYFSPDGKMLVFQSERYPGNPFFQVYTMDLATGRTRLISPGSGRTTCAYFRPGADEIEFASTHLDPNAQQVQAKAYTDRADPNVEAPTWVYDEHYDIFAADRRGRNLRRLTDAVGYDAEGAYSPDGEWIVFGSLRDAYPTEKLTDEQRAIWEKQPEYFAELYIMRADGSEQRRLTDWPGYDGGPFFTADGERIIWRHFHDPSGLTADVYTMKTDGTDRRRLTDFKCMSWAPYMHPSGEYAVFTSNKLGFSNFELFVVDAAGTKQPVRVTYTDGFDGLGVFSPDGKQLAWTTNRASMESRKGQLFLADWDHAAALAAVASAPPRGTEETEAKFKTKPHDGWPASGPPDKVDSGYTAEISRDDLYQHARYLASDELEGRMTGSAGARKAADYIAQRFAEAGLQPLGDDGSFFQAFPFPAGIEMVAEKNDLVFLREGGAVDVLRVDEDFRPLSFTSNGAASGAVVCVGYGLVVPADHGKPAYDSYDGLDVEGKVVLVLDDVPNDISTDERIRYARYSGARYKAKQALAHGAAGVLLVTGPRTAGAGSLHKLARTDSDAGIVAASISIGAAERLLLPAGVSLKGVQKMLDAGEIPESLAKIDIPVSVELTTHLHRQQGTDRNVIALLPGSGESEISDQYIVIGAHYDHIGHGEGGGSRAVAGEEGQVHNGADDNASGVATMLEIAAHLAEQRRLSPDSERRAVIFAAWSGEEVGVIGSAHFARHAPCPLGQIAAYVNFDMVGRLRSGRLILQGVGSSPDWPGLIEAVNVRVPLAVVMQDDPYLPTDTTAFYPAGVPVLAFFTDLHDHYNRPTDDADRLNYAGMQRIARWGAQMAATLSRRPARIRYANVNPPPKQEGGGGRRIYTGTIPDFASSGVAGMKISGVSSGGPAEDAGLQGGDVIVELAGHSIGGLEDYAAILRALKPDETVDIVVMRGDKKITMKITPTVRK